VRTIPVDVNLESGDNFGFNFSPTGERLDEPFEIADGVIIPPGTYEWIRYSVGWEFAAKRKLNGRVRWGFGSFLRGNAQRAPDRWQLDAFTARDLSSIGRA